jgi:putative ABC transport system ATP-binding protein
MSDSAIVVEHLNHHYGEGELRRQVLFDVSTEIRAGEIVILTGPSGSGKTTLLSLIGALRSAQEGRLHVLGRDLRGATEASLSEARRRIGYVFQAHNLLDALTAAQNVRMSLELDLTLGAEEIRALATAALEAVSLSDRADSHPSELSGGQRQRVAIARALARRPAIVLADEPTASLDRQTGRSIVELLEQLARRDGVTVVLVTHDHRILDVADRILTLEDGRIASPLNAVALDGRAKLRLLAQSIRRGELADRVRQLDLRGFQDLLEQVTDETRRLLELVDLIQGDAFESILEQVLDAFSAKLADSLSADRATVFLVERERDELWSVGPRQDGGRSEIRVPFERGVAGRVARTGRPLLVPDAALEPAFDPVVDGGPGDSPSSLLAVPVADSHGRLFAVVELAKTRAHPPFGPADEARLAELTASLGLILETWWRMSCACRSAGSGGLCPCCGATRSSDPAPAHAPVGNQGGSRSSASSSPFES